jgi:uncharacterized membrane protein YeaQ/YmgE (transglycosylase-associated protein family)
MGIPSWLLLALIVGGVLANTLARAGAPGGTAGGAFVALLGGLLFSTIGARGVTGFDVVSLLLIFLIGPPLLLSVRRQLERTEPRPVARI